MGRSSPMYSIAIHTGRQDYLPEAKTQHFPLPGDFPGLHPPLAAAGKILAKYNVVRNCGVPGK